MNLVVMAALFGGMKLDDALDYYQKLGSVIPGRLR